MTTSQQNRTALAPAEPAGLVFTANIRRFLANKRMTVIFGSFALAAISALLLIDNWQRQEWPSIFGLFATFWALFLALVIYVLSAKDTDAILAEISDLTEQVGELAPEPALQDPGELRRALTTFHEYVQALVAEIKIPVEDLESITRPGQGRGNRPVIFDTKRGYRYSVFRGGRAKGGFTVTKLSRRNQPTA